MANSGALTLGSSRENASARLLLKRAATLPNMECRSAGSRMGDSTCIDSTTLHHSTLPPCISLCSSICLSPASYLPHPSYMLVRPDTTDITPCAHHITLKIPHYIMDSLYHKNGTIVYSAVLLHA